jgi:hypothetical protein
MASQGKSFVIRSFSSKYLIVIKSKKAWPVEANIVRIRCNSEVLHVVVQT